MEYPVKKIYKRNLFIIECRFIFYKYTSFLLYNIWIIYSFALDWTWRWFQFYVAFYSKKVLYISRLFAGSYINIYCRYIKKGRKKFGGKSESSYFCTRFSGERGSNGKRGIFLENKNETLRFAVRFRMKKASDPWRNYNRQKSSTRRVKVSVTSQQVVKKK